MPKLTEWYDADTKPVRKGVYEREPVGGVIGIYRWFARWDGAHWRVGDSDIEFARRERQITKSKKRWRGLARLPSGEGR